MIIAFVHCAILIFFFIGLAYLLALIKKDNGLADVFWGLGYATISLFTFLFFSPRSTIHYVATFLMIVWGLRLSLHILSRNRSGHEDERYKNMRKKWGKFQALRSFTDVFLLQGFLLFVILTPIIWLNSSSSSFGFISYVGLVIWLVGFFFEVVGDYQLSKFIKNKKPGEIMTKGLWSYTRHPNYFGEVVMWWGIFLVTLSASGAWKFFISPLLITFLILKVSGIPMLERKYKGNQAFESYKKRTNAFFPWFPKS